MLHKNTVIKGAFLLTVAGLTGKILGFFYRIFLSRTIGAEGLGIYQLIFPLYALAYSMTASGIQTSISRFVSAKTASGDHGGARKIFHIGLMLSVSLSLAVSGILLCFHENLAVSFVKESRTSDLLRLLAYAIPFGSIHACINGYYFGLKQAKIPAIAEILEHIVRLCAVVILYYFFSSRQIRITSALAVYGIIIEEFAASVFSAAMLTHFFAGQPNTARPLFGARHYLLELLSHSTPLTLNRVLVNVLQSIEALLIPQQLCLFGLKSSASLSTYGILTGMAMPLIMFPTAFTSSICTMLLPVISEAYATGKSKRIASVIRKVCASCLLLGISFFLLFFLCGPFLGNLLFHNPLAGTFIRSMAWLCPFAYLNPALTAILNGLGKSSAVFVHSLIGIIIRIAFIIFAIPCLGISGYLLGLLINQLITFLLSMRVLQKEL